MKRNIFLLSLALSILLSCTLSDESWLFPVDDRAYEICYVQNGVLHYYDLASGEQLVFPDTSTIFNFAFTDDNQTLYYTVVENDSLFLKKASFSKGRVSISPDMSKLLFDYPMAFFDLVHGPTSIVGLDGDNLKVLVNDGIALETKPVWLPDGNNVLFVREGHLNNNAAAFELHMTINEENESVLIAEDVDYFMLRN